MKPFNVKQATYIDFNVENNDKDPKVKACDHVRISKYIYFFQKSCTPNWSKDAFVIKKDTVS